MWEIWANELLPKALKSCLKFNKSPNLVILTVDVPKLPILSPGKPEFDVNAVCSVLRMCQRYLGALGRTKKEPNNA